MGLISTITMAADLSSLVAVLQRKIKEREVKIRSLEEQLQTSSSGQDGNHAAPTGVATIQQQLQALEGENAQLKQDLAMKRENETKQQTSEVQRLTSQITSLNAEKENMRAEIEKLTAQNVHAKDETTRLSAQVKTLQASVETFAGQVREKEQALTSLQEENLKLKAQQSEFKPRERPRLIKIIPPMAESASLESGELGKESREEKFELNPEDLATIDAAARWVCPKCGNNNRGMIREENDPTVLLHANPPVYGKKLVCGQCGTSWHHK